MLVGAECLAVAGVVASSLNPLLAAGANNQLESRCSRDPSASWIYDRSSWTPLLWNCTVEDGDGSTNVVRPFRAQLPMSTGQVGQSVVCL